MGVNGICTHNAMNHRGHCDMGPGEIIEARDSTARWIRTRERVETFHSVDVFQALVDGQRTPGDTKKNLIKARGRER